MANDNNLKELQSIEQSMQSIAVQKQNVQVQLAEIDSALREIEGKEVAYKIVGSILIEAKPADLATELTEKKDVAEVRLRTLEKQETRLRERFDAVQKGVLDEMNK